MPAPKQSYEFIDALIKIITDMYGGAKIEDILNAEWIVDSKGHPIKHDGDDQKAFEKIYDLVSSQKDESKVYFQNAPNKDTKEEETLTLELTDDKFVSKKSDKSIIKDDVKSEALLALANVNEELQKYKGKNPDIKNLRDNCETLIRSLTISVDKKFFDEKLGEFAKDAERYYASHGPASLNKKQAKNADLAYNILKIRDDVADGKVTGKPDKIEEIQARIASKYVKAYCIHMQEYGADEKTIQEAKDVLADPKRFNEKVKKTLQDPSFMFMYGRRKEGDEKDLLNRLNEGLSTKAAKVYKKVEKERMFPTEARLEIEAIEKQTPPKRINAHKQYESMSLQDQKPIAQMVKTLREEMDAIGGSGTSSPEFEKLKHELLVADIRLQRENPTMNVQAQMAELGDAVDAYVNKKLQDGKLNSRGLKRLNVAMRLRNLCDGVEQHKKPEDVVKSPDETAKEALATRISVHLAKQMSRSNDPLIAKEGALIGRNKEALEKATKQMLNSETFKEMFSTPEKVVDTLKEDPMKVYNQICKQEFKKAKPEEIQKAKNINIIDKIEETKSKEPVDIKKKEEIVNML